MIFFFFLIIELYFLISAVIAQIFNPIIALVITTGTQTNETNEEIETQPVIVEVFILLYLYTFHSLNHFIYLI